MDKTYVRKNYRKENKNHEIYDKIPGLTTHQENEKPMSTIAFHKHHLAKMRVVRGPNVGDFAFTAARSDSTPSSPKEIWQR
jgi:hypothetical protein